MILRIAIIVTPVGLGLVVVDTDVISLLSYLRDFIPFQLLLAIFYKYTDGTRFGKNKE
jgi:hypothetical protein